MLKFCPRSEQHLAVLPVITVLGSFLFFRNFLFYKEFSGFGSLFSYHCSLLFFWFISSATTSTSYHFYGSLSTTFLFFLKSFFKVFLRSTWCQHWKPL
jgi:hypothetical protein